MSVPATRRRALLLVPAFLFAALALIGATAARLAAQTTEREYLSGTGSDSTVLWDFRVSGGRNAGKWGTIPVPSNWEMQGYGTYHYSDDWSRTPAPDSIGEYRHDFRVPAGWRGRRVDLVIGAAMTDADVRVNGESAGPVHRGGFYQFRYDVSRLLHYGGDNLLEVRVRKFSTDTSIDMAERHADFWLFGGIYRPVWLDALPAQHIARTAIDARHTGAITVDAFLGGIAAPARVVAQVVTLDGRPVGRAFSAPVAVGDTEVVLRDSVPGVRAWSAEFPNRYRLRLQLVHGDAALHVVTETFGFRTIEVRPHDGFYVNGVRVRLKGADRHTFWPTTGRATNRALSVQDVLLLKAMNMNAVRMSHYPPDSHFLDAADSLGLYVVDELTGWQHAYSTAAGRPLVREMVQRDVDHPSIVLWSNGNEGGFNFDLDGDFAKYDPQRRDVIHPWADFGGINTSHYESYDCCAEWFFHGDDLIMPTEFLHGLYDGGAGAGLEDWWRLMLATPLAVGGFIWSFADEGIVRGDEGGRVDVNGNTAPDGILGPYRQKEGSFYTIKKIWAPVYLPWSAYDFLPATFTGALRVENRYDFTDLRQVRFSWELRDLAGPWSTGAAHTVAARGVASSPAVPPRGVGTLRLALPGDWRGHDVLALTATDPYGREIYTWTWMIRPPEAIAERVIAAAPPGAREGTGRVTADVRDGIVTMAAGGLEVRIDSATGRLARVSRDGVALSLRNGPRLVEGTSTLRSLDRHADGDDYVIDARYAGELQEAQWRLTPAGWLRLTYSYRLPHGASRRYLGVTFDYPDSAVTGLRWLGRGPYRVWKNRLGGVEFDVWHKAYNDAMTGLRWEYPEFKGFHEDMYWATLETRELPVTMVFDAKGLFLRVLTPAQPTEKNADPKHERVEFPAGDLSFLHGIIPIGSKFHDAADAGPAGAPNMISVHGQTFADTVWFHFGRHPGAAN